MKTYHLSTKYLTLVRMKLSTLILAAISGAAACPGMDRALEQLNSRISKRQAGEPLGPNDSFEMIGDLATVGPTTKVGQDISDILNGKVDPYSDVKFNLMSKLACLLPGADVCCIWGVIAKEMENKFRGSAGRCNQYAREAVRLGFHDAGAWSKTTGYGGADGSIILAGEMSRPENNGLQEIVTVMEGWYKTYKPYGVGMADLIQMGATVATVVCPLGPRIRSFVGRKDSTRPNADNLLPPVTGSADFLVQLFKDKTIYPHGLAALVGAHTTSQQRFVDPSRALDPQDSTPGVWDVLFYGQTIDKPAPPSKVFKFQSDVVLAAHPEISEEWQKFASPGGQDDWNEVSFYDPRQA